MIATALLVYTVWAIVWFIMRTVALVKNNKKPLEEREKRYIEKFVISLVLFFFALIIIALFVFAMMIVATM